MAFALLWIEALAIGMSWVALLAAVINRSKSSVLRGILYVPMLVPLVPCIGMLIVATSLEMRGVTPNGLIFAASLTTCFVIAGSLLTWRILRGKTPSRHPAWPALALLLTIVAGWMTVIHVDDSARARGAAERAAVRAAYKAALPPMRSSSENAALLYQQAFANLSAAVPEELNNPPEGTNETFDPHEPATHAYLEQLKPTLELLRTAATRPACHFTEDDREPSLDSMPKLAVERHAANVLWLHAEQAAADGDVADAMRDIDTIFRFSRHMSQRPMLSSGLVAVGINALGHKALLETLPTVRSAQDLSPLHPQQWTSLTGSFVQVLRGEERLGLSLLDGPASNAVAGVKVSSPRSGVSTMARALLCDPDLYIDLMHQFQAIAPLRYVDAKPALDALDRSRNMRGLVVSILVPSVVRTFSTYARSDANDATAQAAIAMTRYRLDHGTLSSSIKDLTPNYLPQLPIDPFDGQPIRMASRGEDRLIYSVGPDGIDDGGAELNKDRGDIGVVLKSRVAATTTAPSL